MKDDKIDCSDVSEKDIEFWAKREVSFPEKKFNMAEYKRKILNVSVWTEEDCVAIEDSTKSLKKLNIQEF